MFRTGYGKLQEEVEMYWRRGPPPNATALLTSEVDMVVVLEWLQKF